MEYIPEPGDTVRASIEFIVKEVGSEDYPYYVVTEKGKSMRFRLPPNVRDTPMNPVFSLELVHRPEKKPEHWPPQRGDLWRCRKTGKEYYVTSSLVTVNGLSYKTDDGETHRENSLRTSELVYRKGDSR